MTTHRAIACALALAIAASTSVWGAEKKKTVKKPVGRTETLACKLGTEDRHARIAVVVIKGKTDSFAYYSKWKPRTCSIYLERNRDPYSKWADTGDVTTVSLEKGAFLIEHKPGEYHFIFRDVDRERYCGMDGVINGTLTIKRGTDQCILGGEIMAEGTPLGHVPAAYANVEPTPAAGASETPAAIAAPASITPADKPTATAGAAAPKTAASGSGAVKSAGAAAGSTPESAPAAAVAEQAVAEPAESEIGAAEPAREEASAGETGGTRTASAEPSAARAQASAEPAKEPKSAQRPPIAAAQAGPAAAPTTASAEPESEAPSGNPLRAFFRSIAPRSAEETTPFPN